MKIERIKALKVKKGGREKEEEITPRPDEGKLIVSNKVSTIRKE